MSALLRAAVIVLATLVLVACGQSESEQRAAFIGFLEKDVLPRPGARFPALTEERRKAFGAYAGQYEIITRFHETMNRSVAEPMQAAISRAAPSSIEEIVKRRADIEAVRGGLGKIREALDAAYAGAERERAALKQPDELAAAYGKVFDKLVEKPVAAVREMFPAADDVTGSVLAFADLIEKNKAQIKLSGSLVEVKDAKLRAKVQEAMNAFNVKRERINAVAQNMRKAFDGQ